MKRPCSVDNGIRNQMKIEGCQLSAVCSGERQEIAVCHLRRIQETTAVNVFCVKQRDVVGPEFVAR